MSAETYCLARLGGMTDADAAIEAGYKGRTPGSALKMWDRVKLVDECRTPVGDLEVQVERLQRQFDRVREKLVEANRWLTAARIVARVSEGRRTA